MGRAVMIFLAMLAGLSSAFWTNDALPDMMEARYEYVTCDVEYADRWLDMREDCAAEADVPVFDSSDYMGDLYDDLDDLSEAVSDVDRLEFGLAMWQLGADALDLLGAIFKDALDGKNMGFFSCVRDGEKPLMDQRDGCRDDALELARKASKDYVDNELEHAGGQVEELDALGADTGAMEEVLDHGEELVGDIDDAYGSDDVKEIRKLHLRHSRLVLLFRLERMLSVIDYAEPIIEDSRNSNKDEVLQRGDELRDDVEDLLVRCEYDDEVDDNFDYARDNLECWDDALDLFKEFNRLRGLLLEGI